MKNRAEVDDHIAALQRAVDSESRAATSPPMTTAAVPVPASMAAPEPPNPAVPPSSAPPVAPSVAPAPAPAVEKSTLVGAAKEKAVESKPLARRAWFWGALGAGAAVVAAGVTLGVVLGRPADPSSTLGTIGGN